MVWVDSFPEQLCLSGRVHLFSLHCWQNLWRGQVGQVTTIQQIHYNPRTSNWQGQVCYRLPSCVFTRTTTSRLFGRLGPYPSVETSSLQLGWPPWGEGFCRYKVKKWGGGLQNPKQGSDLTLHSLQNGNPNGTFFCPLFLVVPSFWLYKILNLGRIFAFCPRLTPACWH